MSSTKLILFIFAVSIFELVNCTILIKRKYTNQTVEQFYDLPAQFGPNLPSSGLIFNAIQAIPYDGCSESPPPPPPDYIDDGDVVPPIIEKKYVLIIARNNCSFEQKVRNAQNSRFDAAIVYNIGSDDLEQMSAKTGGRDIVIPSVFVGESTGRYIIDSYLDDNNFVLVINDDIPFNINTHLIIPFSILVGLCFIIMIVYTIYKCVREQRRLRQHRLPKRLLKKIPVIKFVEGHPYETCVICLEDYAKGERLRILPCAHAYHCHCIDTWLTKNRRNCPICKRRVFARGETRNSRRRPASSDSVSDTDDDTQPLLNAVLNIPTNHGTFMHNHRIRDVEDPTTDDENILANGNQTSERVNPFDRVPNLPQNIANELNNEHRGNWGSSLFRFLRRNRQTSSSRNEADTPVLDATVNPNEISISVQIQQPSSNNILNTNLSGSFKDSDDDDDDQIAVAPTIYEPISGSSTTIQIPTNNNGHDHRNNNNNNNGGPIASSSLTRNNNQIDDTSDVFIQTPSQGGIGVAALPNTNVQQPSQLRDTPRWWR